jgi:nucleotide-binding universal stress UspA family protein
MMYQNILVPLDGSALAERVLPAALQLAEAKHGSITLLTVVAKKPGENVNLMAKAIQTGEYEADLYLRSVKKHLLPSVVPIKTAVIIGKPDKDIIQYAKEHETDLIIMSTHGRSGITRWSFGRTADKVLRRSPCPTVILRSQYDIEPDQFKRILLPLDGSPLAERVLVAALEMAKDVDVELFMIHVVERGSFYGFGHDEVHINQDIETAQTYLAELRDRAIPADVAVHSHVAVGSSADVIVDYAEAQAIDLIIVSSRGVSGFDSWMFGSVAEKVMKGAPCAILVIRQEPFE